MPATLDMNTIESFCTGLRQRPDLDALFAPHPEGYLGADAALSIPLPDGRCFWAFGDTLLGTIENGRRNIHAMPRNTAAIQSGRMNDPAAVTWAIRQNADFFTLPASAQPRWFWPGTGFVLDAELYILGYSVTAAKGACEALSFHVEDQWLMRVRKPLGNPLDWHIEPSPLLNAPRGPWHCSASCILGEYIHLVGVAHLSDEPHRSAAIAARVLARELATRGPNSRFQYWGGPATGWTGDVASATNAYTPGVTECSIYHDMPRARFLATTYDAHAAEFLVTSARRTEGPWSAPKPVFRLPNRGWRNGSLAYAFRMHPHLPAAPGEIVFSYVVNGLTLNDVVEDTTIYHPRFLSIPLDAL